MKTDFTRCWVNTSTGKHQDFEAKIRSISLGHCTQLEGGISCLLPRKPQPQPPRSGRSVPLIRRGVFFLTFSFLSSLASVLEDILVCLISVCTSQIWDLLYQLETNFQFVHESNLLLCDMNSFMWTLQDFALMLEFCYISTSCWSVLYLIAEELCQRYGLFCCV